MENDTPNQTINQLPVQHISKAAVCTHPGFTITACNPATSALFLYNQQDIPGLSISFRVSTYSKNSQPLWGSLTNIAWHATAKTAFSKLQNEAEPASG
ncbi:MULTISPECIES: hypothetical protein [Niastella]|uniref:Uncharacterized protein n=1 Tax=Niastella soli TaxID=2821487 RepID=A0ABS3YZV9_9BACT|nr:hypothetical protein [Niastella soli]MBO9203461.1 hypothetical protein [Niastella soli]